MSAMQRIQTLPRTYHNTCPTSVESDAGLRGGTHEPYQDGHLTITPILHDKVSSFGATIEGVDWSRPLSDGDVEKVGTIKK